MRKFTYGFLALVTFSAGACGGHVGSRAAPGRTTDRSAAASQAVKARGSKTLSYPIVDTGQTGCYDDRSASQCPRPGRAFFGQDAQYLGAQPAYVDNHDGTITDRVTGLMWQKSMDGKTTWDAAVAGAARFELAGHDDWRLPTIKELYSLINFNGGSKRTADASTPYLDTRYFDFVYGNASAGERPIDSQTWTATEYVGRTMGGDATVFGVNFADGRIKGYPKMDPRSGFTRGQKMHVRYVRGNPDYGNNHFVDNGDGTVTDRATGLTWQRGDSGKALNWRGALDYAETMNLAGHDDWRLPNAKELQSIVDYTRAPAVTNGPAIDPLFEVTETESYYWTGTSHLEGPPHVAGRAAVYVSFGRALGHMQRPRGIGRYQLLDVHGAGAQRSDPKAGTPADYPRGRGPQGDDIRIFNFVRAVRGGGSSFDPNAGARR